MRAVTTLRLVALTVLATHLPPCVALSEAPYLPTPENLKARETFQDDRFGIFIHWGVYSVLGRGEWVLHNDKMTINQYERVAERFNPVLYDPDAWCRLFKAVGAKYITITSKHHDGFALWDSKVSDWDVVDRTPYKKDLLKPLAEACRRHGLKLFFYHSHLDWRHPDYFPRGETGRFTGRPDSGDFSRYLDYMDAQLAELLGGEYGDVAGIWFDGVWDQKTPQKDDPPATYLVDWRLRRTYDGIHALQRACMVGNNHHLTPLPGEDFQMFERDLPGQNAGGFSAEAAIGDLPLETCDTISGTWGYYENDQNLKSTREIVRYLVRASGQGANLLLNIGPKPDGTIPTEFVSRLEKLGDWLNSNGESIYGTRAGPVPPQDWGVSTRRGKTVYLHVLKAPQVDAQGWVTLSGTGALASSSLTLLDGGAAVESGVAADGVLRVRLPAGAAEALDTVLIAAPRPAEGATP
jgi:alpha-L-fucosidase